jgi:hypothetical protein
VDDSEIHWNQFNKILSEFSIPSDPFDNDLDPSDDDFDDENIDDELVDDEIEDSAEDDQQSTISRSSTERPRLRVSSENLLKVLHTLCQLGPKGQNDA